jgi:hypothetical protein
MMRIGPLTGLGRETQRRVSEKLRRVGFGLDAFSSSNSQNGDDQTE